MLDLHCDRPQPGFASDEQAEAMPIDFNRQGVAPISPKTSTRVARIPAIPPYLMMMLSSRFTVGDYARGPNGLPGHSPGATVMDDAFGDPLTFCMPCTQVLSEAVWLGPLCAGQGATAV